MKYIVATSGGVDSVVLLDMLVKANKHDIVVAHFDHGIREDSASDARFVTILAQGYGLPCESKREELGNDASEATARARRYDFLRSVAHKHNGTIVTAHHRDDVIETIAINIHRGTGWRGLNVLGDSTIERPLTAHTKQDLYAYALKHGLEWVEDETNTGDVYLRNRIRRKLGTLPSDTKTQLAERWVKQNKLTLQIDAEASRLKTASRHFLTMIDEPVALELLRVMLADYGVSLTRPQRRHLLNAIKTAAPGTKFEAGARTTIEFTVREFIVKHPL